MQEKSTRNRKRSKRRQIFCPVHGCYLDSVSPKYTLYADKAEHLQQRGMGRRLALLVVATHTAVPLKGEWLECFWCSECEENQWYYVQEAAPRQYALRLAPPELWQQVQGVINPNGNPSVGEFTRRQSRMMTFRGLKDFQAVG
jgi:hypothetical protein